MAIVEKVIIFKGENSGDYVVSEFYQTEGYLKISGKFHTTTKPGDLEVFTLYDALNTLTA